MHFAPAIHPTLIRLADELDDGREAIAAIWRELGHRARAQTLVQPSYESVRRIVHVQRAWRRLMRSAVIRATLLAAEFVSNPRSRKEILFDVLAGGDAGRRSVLRAAARSPAPASAARNPSETASPLGAP
jgi:hypothetical protein